MPKQYPAEIKDRALRKVLDHPDDYPSLRAACVAISDRLGVSRASLQRWVDQAKVDADAKPGLSSIVVLDAADCSLNATYPPGGRCGRP